MTNDMILFLSFCIKMILFLVVILLILAIAMMFSKKQKKRQRRMRSPYLSIQSERFAGMMPVSAIPTLKSVAPF